MKLYYDWNLKDAVFEKNKGSVFSCFSCGGGSTMGYKLAGFDVIGCNEIDPRMMEIYKANHKPKYAFLEPIQDFAKRESYPDELYNLDILDGSPPCSSFSMAGSREKAWGKEKKFREGQANQVLDTLFFDFIDLAKKLKSKVIVAENVKGLLIGQATAYLHKILKAFDDAGYYAQYFLLDASKMGVPQCRERVFFICFRKDLAEPFLYQATLFDVLPKISIEFGEKPIEFKHISDYADKSENLPDSVKKYYFLMGNKKGGLDEVHPTGSFFSEVILDANYCCNTLTSKNTLISDHSARRLNINEIRKISSFPQDYNFGKEKPAYVCGMSVPPIMTARVANEIYNQWLSKIG